MVKNAERAIQVWNDTTVLLNRDTGRKHSSINAMFSSLVPVDISDSELILKTSNLYTKDWVERRMTEAINDAIWSVSGVRYAFRIIVCDDPVEKPQTKPELDAGVSTPVSQNGHVLPAPSDNLPDALPTGVVISNGSPNGRLEIDPYSGQIAMEAFPSGGRTLAESLLNNGRLETDVATPTNSSSFSQTFETFVVGEANRRAFDMSYYVAKDPGYIMNPLFIYGKSGLGKTHLMLSIRHFILQSKPELKVIYIQTSDLVSEYSQAARRQSFSEFNDKYYSADVLLLDDVQLLERRQETTNTVFDIFNRLSSNNRQVVLSADRAPTEIDLHERYLSRFSSGAMADIQPLSFETKLTIFSNKLDYYCRHLNCQNIRELIRDDVIEYIVSLSASNLRELEGAATNLVWTLSTENKSRYIPITVEEAAVIVEKYFKRPGTKSIDIPTVQKEVETFYGISHADMLSAKRSQDISYPRQVAMYLCRRLTGASLPRISIAFDKDHTAVMYACNNIEKKRQTSSKTDIEIKQLIDAIVG